MKTAIVILGFCLAILFLPQVTKLIQATSSSWQYKATYPPQDADALQLKEMEKMNETLQDIRGLLNSIAENTRR